MLVHPVPASLLFLSTGQFSPKAFLAGERHSGHPRAMQQQEDGNRGGFHELGSAVCKERKAYSSAMLWNGRRSWHEVCSCCASS